MKFWIVRISVEKINKFTLTILKISFSSKELSESVYFNEYVSFDITLRKGVLLYWSKGISFSGSQPIEVNGQKWGVKKRIWFSPLLLTIQIYVMLIVNDKFAFVLRLHEIRLNKKRRIIGDFMQHLQIYRSNLTFSHVLFIRCTIFIDT